MCGKVYLVRTWKFEKLLDLVFKPCSLCHKTKVVRSEGISHYDQGDDK